MIQLHSEIEKRVTRNVFLAPALLSLCLASLPAKNAFAATPGSLDTSFDVDGIVTTDFGGTHDEGFAVAMQSDGKIVLAGKYNNGAQFAVARYNSNGSLDTSFNGTGKVTTDFGGLEDWGLAVAIQPNGKIVVAGTTHVSGSN